MVVATSSAKPGDTHSSGSANTGTASAQRSTVMRAKRTGRRRTARRSAGVGPRVSPSHVRMRSKTGAARR
jgi:hypothetical protein